MTEVSTSRSGRLWAVTKPWLIWLIFFLVGPLIGLLAVLMGSGIAAIFSQPVERAEFLHNPFMWPVKLLQYVVWAYPWALLFGGVQAGLVGIVATRSYRFRGRVSFWAVVSASLIAYAGFMALVILPLVFREYSAPLPDLKPLLLFALVHVTAAAGCWAIVSRLRNHTPRKLEGRVVA